MASGVIFLYYKIWRMHLVWMMEEEPLWILTSISCKQEITSSQFFDLFFFTNKTRKKIVFKSIEIGYYDDYNDTQKTYKPPKCKLRENSHLLSDYVTLIYSSIWSYALNIPFPKIPNFPAPLKFAEHYSSWQYSILTADDKDLQQLSIDLDNAKPKICKPIIENKAFNDNDVEMK